MKLPRLYLIVDYALPTVQSMDQATLAKLLSPAIACVQYRDKQASPAQRWQRAQCLLHICQQQKIPCIINDSVHLAKKLDADGVHIGHTDMPLDAARKNLGDDKIIGVSCYQSLQCAQNAQAQGANYVAFGAAFPSPSKPEAKPLQLAQLKSFAAKLSIPVCVIGGITATNVHALLDYDIDLIAVASGILEHAAPQQAIQDLHAQIQTVSER